MHALSSPPLTLHRPHPHKMPRKTLTAPAPRTSTSRSPTTPVRSSAVPASPSPSPVSPAASSWASQPSATPSPSPCSPHPAQHPPTQPLHRKDVLPPRFHRRHPRPLQLFTENTLYPVALVLAEKKPLLEDPSPLGHCPSCQHPRSPRLRRHRLPHPRPPP